MKETLEVFDAADASLDAVTKACEDGKLTVLDLPKALPAVRATVTAIKGKEKIPGELKGLDEEKAALLASRLFTTFDKAAKAVEAVANLKG